MTDGLEFAALSADELAAVFERAIPFSELLGLRCLEIRTYHPEAEDRPIAAGMGVSSVRRDAGADRRARWSWQGE
jgi:hypothetical protein